MKASCDPFPKSSHISIMIESKKALYKYFECNIYAGKVKVGLEWTDVLPRSRVDLTMEYCKGVKQYALDPLRHSYLMDKPVVPVGSSWIDKSNDSLTSRATIEDLIKLSRIPKYKQEPHRRALIVGIFDQLFLDAGRFFLKIRSGHLATSFSSCDRGLPLSSSSTSPIPSPLTFFTFLLVLFKIGSSYSFTSSIGLSGLRQTNSLLNSYVKHRSAGTGVAMYFLGRR